MLTTCARLEDVDHLLPADDFMTIGQWGALEISRRGPTEGRESYVAVILNGLGPGFILMRYRDGGHRRDHSSQADTAEEVAALVQKLI